MAYTKSKEEVIRKKVGLKKDDTREISNQFVKFWKICLIYLKL